MGEQQQAVGEEPASLSWLLPLRLLLLVHCRLTGLRDNGQAPYGDSPLSRSFYFSDGGGDEDAEQRRCRGGAYEPLIERWSSAPSIEKNIN